MRSSRTTSAEAPADVAFKFDSECGRLYPYTSSPAPTNSIPSGDWVVGAEIPAGTYASTVAEGCYWERVTGFGGTFDELIANDFVSDAGQAYVTISGTDAGFSTDADCGTWIRVG